MPLPGEQQLLESDTGQLILTTHRIRFDATATGSARIVSIMLEEVDSCEVTTKSHPWLLLLAAVSFFFGVYLGPNNVLGFVAAATFVFAYFVNRTQTLSIYSAATSIDLRMKGMSLDTARNFIDAVEKAKNARYLQSGKTGAPGGPQEPGDFRLNLE